MVNIATGNLLEQNVDMQIAGTGQNLDIEGYYNSRSNSSRDLGYGWNLSVGPDVRLDLSNPSAGITYHGPSGFSAYFTYNSSTGKYMI